MPSRGTCLGRYSEVGRGKLDGTGRRWTSGEDIGSGYLPACNVSTGAKVKSVVEEDLPARRVEQCSRSLLQSTLSLQT